MLSEAQEQLLEANEHLVLASILDDGDALILDLFGPPPTSDRARFVEHYGPYILTADGKVQDVNAHYARYHGKKVAYA